MTNAGGRDPLGPARRFAIWLGAIVSAASVSPPFVWNETAVRCRRRPRHTPCAGRLRVRPEDGGPIAWACPMCADQGTISGWQGSADDLREVRAAAEHQRHALLLTELEYDLLARSLLLDDESRAVVFGAAVTASGIMLRASPDELELLEGNLAFEASHSATRKRERLLEGILGKIDALQRRRAWPSLRHLN